MDYLLLPNKNCKKCKHLDSQERTYFKCNDSPDCPAREVQIVIKSRAEEFAKKYKAAMYEGNLVEQKNVLEQVLKESVSFKQHFSELLLKKEQ